MNIDLFLTKQSEAGLICNGAFDTPVMGVIHDAQTQEITLEFTNGETLHLNIPVEEAYREKLLFANKVYIGYFEDAYLTDTFEVPLFYLNDPYGSAFGDPATLPRARRAVIAFEQFMKRCTFAQGVNRDNLGDEGNARSVLRGIDPQALKYSPALQRQIQLAAAAARMQEAPQAPGPGGAMGGAAVKARNDKKSDTDEKKESGDGA